MSRRQRQSQDTVLCEMPVAIINSTLEMEIDAGIVVLSEGAKKHAKRSHPNDFDACLPHVAGIVANPLYVGDDHNNEGIELIGRAHVLGQFILVAVNISLDENGRYHVLSFYPISEEKITNRRLKGYLKVAARAAIQVA